MEDRKGTNEKGEWAQIGTKRDMIEWSLELLLTVENTFLHRSPVTA